MRASSPLYSVANEEGTDASLADNKSKSADASLADNKDEELRHLMNILWVLI